MPIEFSLLDKASFNIIISRRNIYPELLQTNKAATGRKAEPAVSAKEEHKEVTIEIRRARTSDCACGCGHNSLIVTLSLTHLTISSVEEPGSNIVLTPFSLRRSISSFGTMPPPNNVTSSIPFSLKSLISSGNT